MNPVEKMIKAMGLLIMAVITLMIMALALIGACSEPPARASSVPMNSVSRPADDQACVWWEHDAVGCGAALVLPFVGPVVVGCAISRELVRGEVIFGLSCRIFYGLDSTSNLPPVVVSLHNEGPLLGACSTRPAFFRRPRSICAA